jgi:hypothetical protein
LFDSAIEVDSEGVDEVDEADAAIVAIIFVLGGQF